MYELTDDEKRRIREEEEAAVERERYRAFVRQQVQPESLPETAKRAPKVQYFIPWGRVLAFTIVVAIGIVVIGQYSTLISQSDTSDETAKGSQGVGGTTAVRQPVTRIRREPHLVPFVSEQTVVKAGSYVWYTLRVDAGMESARLICKFSTRGGSGNDIEAALGSPADLQNWANGHAASLIWSTPGKVTAGNLDQSLQPGTYQLGFSNKFSAFSDKYVTIEAKLSFERISTVVE